MLKIQKFVKSYYDFFDNKKINSTVIVGMIGSLIFLVGLIFQTANASFLKGSINDLKIKKTTNFHEQIINIGGKNYKLILQEIK